jgi:hypothetical protein
MRRLTPEMWRLTLELQWRLILELRRLILEMSRLNM